MTVIRRYGVWLLLAASSCSVSDGVLGRLTEGNDFADGGSTAAGSCALTSPVVTLQDHATCTGRLAASRFSSALCVCDRLQLADALTTRGFDSNQGPYQAGRSDDSGAAVGVNGDYSLLAGATDIAGSFSVAGTGEIRLVGALTVRGDFHAGGNVSVTGITTVARDAWLAGSFSGLGPLIVTGTLHHAGTVSALPLLAPANQQQAVSIAKPCPCESAELLNINELVDAAKRDNDNKRQGITPDLLAAIAGSRELTLPCGRIFLSQIAGSGDLVLDVVGNTALFIDGSINLKGALSFKPFPGAEIDVFVRQDLAVQGPLGLAYQERPAAGRMSVGGTQAIVLTTPLVGNLYAPAASVTSAAGLEIWGALFAKDLASTSVTFIFDRDIVAVGTDCTAPRPPAGLCTKCEWCYGGAACVGGVCGPCQADSDCCGQAVCLHGRCEPYVDVTE
jgi:hypothetical protein